MAYIFQWTWNLYGISSMAFVMGCVPNSGKTIIDPVIPKALDGLSASLVYAGYPLNLNFFQ